MTFSNKDQMKTLLIDHDFMKQPSRRAAFRNFEGAVHNAVNIESCRFGPAHSCDLIPLTAGSILRSSRTKFLPRTS
jgi:hypothetical protein